MSRMSMAENPSTRPITAAMLRKPQAVSALSLPGVKKLSRHLPTAVASVLALFSDLSPRIAIEDITEDADAGTLEHVSAGVQGFDTGTLGVTAACDRAMAFAVTDLGFGGTGDEPPFVSAERPLSATENGLVNMLLGKLLEALHPLVAVSFDLTALSAAGPAKSEPPASGETHVHIVFRVLVNVLGYDGELKIGLNRDHLLGLASAGTGAVASSPASDAGAGTISGGVGASHADLTVTLADETLTVEALMALAPGQLLPLRSTVHAPVQVWSGGVPLFPARLMRTGNHIAVRIGG